MKDRISLMFAGCGHHAGYMAWAAKLSRIYNLTSCMDSNAERAELFKKKHGFKSAYSNYIEMLDSGNRETENLSGGRLKQKAVYIASPHTFHYRMIMDALSRGYNVFTEKPITTSVEDAFKIVSESAKLKLKVGVNYQYNYIRECRKLINLTSRGRLGKPLYAVVHVPWSRESDYFDKALWHCRKDASGGGTLLTQASHSLDIAIQALAGNPVQALGITDRLKFKDIEVEDFASGIITLNNGTYINITGSMTCAFEQPVRIEIFGSRGYALFSGPSRSRLKVKIKNDRQSKRKSGGTAFTPTEFHPLLWSMKDFGKWLLGISEYRTTALRAIPVLEAVLGLYKSAAERRQIEIGGGK
ncbi:MAG: Gfo/Idh/MocA family oxidoreductase [Spirochaetales bacterium]|nr:Gfo/Idh/MocA family oxidoreductase [Spirochaetales bacterium]